MNVKLNNTKFIKTASSNNLPSYINFSLNKNKFNKKIIGNFKHTIPNNKEWFNSIYSYNNNYLADLAIKNKLVTKSINNYINMTIFQKIKNESGLKLYRIMRKQIRISRKSLKNIIVAKPEIKYTNDKAIITLYLLDKEKESMLRKTFFFARSFKLNKILKLYLKELTKGKTHLSHKWQYNINKRYDKFFIQQNSKSNKILNSIPTNRFAENINDYVIYKKKLIISLIRKKHFFKNAFFFMFLKWTLLLLMIKIYIINSKNNKFILLVNSLNNNKTMFHLKNDLFLSKLEKINNILLSILFKTITNGKKNFNKIPKEKIISFLFMYYKNKYLAKFINRYLKKQSLFLHQIYKISINNFRYNKFIPGIKLLADKIFDKKIELNFVNLKYLHLNSTILVKSIATRLKRKTTQLLLVLKRSLKLVKLPVKLDLLSSKYKKNNIDSFSSLDVLNSYKDINVNLLTNFISHKKPTRDVLNDTLLNVFNFLNKNLWWSFLNKVNVNNFNQHNVLNSIKHKWVKGVRIETKGRLTKRYTASRSVFKFKYKGNLRDLSSSNNISSSMSRGYVKSNIIYTFVGSKRRIGAFGIKGWISTY